MALLNDKDIQDFFNGESSDESAIADAEQTISPGDIIEFYNEFYVKGSKFSYQQCMVTSLKTPEEGWISCDIAYGFTSLSEVRILAKLQKDGTYKSFEGSKVLYIKNYNIEDKGYYKGEACGIRALATRSRNRHVNKIRTEYNNFMSEYKKNTDCYKDDDENIETDNTRSNNNDDISTELIEIDNDISKNNEDVGTEDIEMNSELCIIDENEKEVLHDDSNNNELDQRNNSSSIDKAKISREMISLNSFQFTKNLNLCMNWLPTLLPKPNLSGYSTKMLRRKMAKKKRRKKRKRIIFCLRKFLLYKCAIYKTKMDNFSMQRSISAIKRNPSVRVKWVDYSGNMSDIHFRRRFRMNKDCFNKLCMTIKKHVGENEFKSEAFLTNEANYNSKMSHVIRAMKKATGGFVCGEVKLAITLRILAGGSYLDVSDIFHVVPTSCFPMFHKTIKEWICDNPHHDIDIKKYLNDNDAMNRTAFKFGQTSNGLFRNVIGALDGWLVKIICPSMSCDEMKNQGQYHSRKGFYALNVQVIVDKDKRVLWHSIRSRGGAHDSSAFKASKLHDYLVEISERLTEGGYFFVGDSAYGIRNF